ncbi:unnamed protein product [Allacma fusca]|uniref:Uncharacterized protein n=1 Tax=Allacma fusca TaxID=39272 RepID=A0A8J2KWB1_9HEXA|nr:unnamed protein product [Allacma fusca]
MTFDLAYTFSYTGINGKNNFSALNINDLIFDVVQLNPKTSAENMMSVRKKIQKWVQHAGDHLPKSAKLTTRVLKSSL